MAFSISNMRCVEAYAKSITAKAHKVRRKHGGRHGKIDVIGFSMGGVATLYALKRLKLARHVGRFIAVAAPFRGADLAYLGFASVMFAKAGRQLKPDSKFLQALEIGPLPPGPEYTALSGEKDRLCPADRTELEGARNILLPFRHADFLFSPRLHEEILNLLA
jgi:pimeloyl-ACP methyl ester carboxylesterase